jgi:flagellar L-ring protein FlgH
MKASSKFFSKAMRSYIFTVAIIICSLFTAGNAQDKKDKKKKTHGEPKLSVVEVQTVPPVVAEPEVQRPTNGSLFTDNSVNGNLLRDFKARAVGDLVFVDVVEESTATVTSSAKRDRDSGNLGGIVPLVSALPVNGAATAGSVLTELGQRKFEGKGTTGRTSNVRSRITARVIEVFPNGDMRIEAVKLVKINKETEQLAVTGIVRPNDLARDNSIETTSVGDLRVEFNGKGIASADNAPGWLFRFFDKISPF